MNEVIDQQPNIPGYIAKKIKLSTTENGATCNYLSMYIFIHISF